MAKDTAIAVNASVRTLQGHPVVFAEQLTESGYREIVLQYVNA